MQHHKREVTEIIKGAFDGSTIEFDIIRPLGDGAYGSVQLIECPNIVINKSKQLALKFFKSGKDSFLYEISRFIRTQKSINHSFINKAYGYSISMENECVLYLEYISGGTLWRAISNSPQNFVSPYLLGFCLAEISEGLNMIHNIGLIHQDLHMENVLIRSNGHLAICDFGLAWSLASPYVATHRGMRAGNSLHYAPELRKADVKFICQSVDYYSLGVMMYVIATRNDPVDPLSPQYKRLKDTMFNEVHQTFRSCLQGLMDPSRHTRLGNGMDGNIPLLLTNAMKSTIWNLFEPNCSVEKIKEKIRNLQLPSPFVMKC